MLMINRPGLYDTYGNMVLTWDELTAEDSEDIRLAFSKIVMPLTEYQLVVDGSSTKEIILSVLGESEIGAVSFNEGDQTCSIEMIRSLIFAFHINELFVTDTIGDIHKLFSNATKISIDTRNPHYKYKDKFLVDDTETFLYKYVGNEKEVKVPEDIVFVEKLAFVAKNVERVIMPSVINLGEQAFYACQHLKSIVAPYLSEIGSKAFEGCKELETFEVKDDLKIAHDAFHLAKIQNLILHKVPKSPVFTFGDEVDEVIPFNLAEIENLLIFKKDESKIDGELKANHVYYLDSLETLLDFGKTMTEANEILKTVEEDLEK